jgi:hypothetical protein
MTTLAQKAKWPGDAVMIVAALAGTEIREHMESVVPCDCRDCGRLLHADSRTIRAAFHLPSRRGRPVEFFCVECCMKYDAKSVNEMHDCRGDYAGDRIWMN